MLNSSFETAWITISYFGLYIERFSKTISQLICQRNLACCSVLHRIRMWSWVALLISKILSLLSCSIFISIVCWKRSVMSLWDIVIRFFPSLIWYCCHDKSDFVFCAFLANFLFKFSFFLLHTSIRKFESDEYEWRDLCPCFRFSDYSFDFFDLLFYIHETCSRGEDIVWLCFEEFHMHDDTIKFIHHFVFEVQRFVLRTLRNP